MNGYESRFLAGAESLIGLSGQLNNYYLRTGNPDYFNQDLARYKALAPSDIQASIVTFLRNDARLILSIVPEGKPELAATKKITSEDR